MQLLVNGLIAGSLAALVAGGLALVYGVLGVFNLALGQMVLFSGYLTWWSHTSLGLGLIPSIAFGLLGGMVLALLTFRIFIEPFYKRHRFLPLVTTISLSMILDASILLLFGERPKSIVNGAPETFPIFGGNMTQPQVGLIIFTIVLLSILAYVLHSTRFGRRIRAVVQHGHAAESLGIPTRLLHHVLFIASGLLAACAGIFIGIDQNLTPTLGFFITIKAYAAIIAGGKGNVWGAILLAYVIALVEQVVIGVHWFGSFYVPAGYQNSIALVFIILFLIWRPSGLLARSARTG